ncbi:MAG TPA: SpoIVB peptidase S55 domain-containing protein, partial [Bryobacteraceae bacterium]|nr:SpoIVB peptidase S55 domain-containing protein [Bryobacteraceae bacterium]
MPRILRPAALLWLSLSAAGAAFGALNIMPLSDIRAGQHGVGRTVFSGDKIEEFQVEILGVLANTGPKESLILGRLSGGPLEHTGVMQGMSGSPVYVDGKLIGAVAMAFPYAKDPIAGIRPIEEMVRVDSLPYRRGDAPAIALRKRGGAFDSAALLPVLPHEEGRMTEVATPISLSGFTG